MDQSAAHIVTRTFLRDIRERLEEATNTAKAAETCADNGNVERAVRMVMDFEDLAFQAQELFKAALLMNRMSRFESD